MKPMTLTLAGVLLAGTAFAQNAAVAQDYGPNASARFVDQQGQEVGVATLAQTPDGVEITGQVTGLAEGMHGFHIHQTGECDPAQQFQSAGSHFAPQNNEHGAENPEGPHAGDMGNISANAEGMAAIDVVNERVSLNEGEEGYLLDDDGAALMIHADEDDQMTDPGGNSGDRVACAVIEAGSAQSDT